MVKRVRVRCLRFAVAWLPSCLVKSCGIGQLFGGQRAEVFELAIGSLKSEVIVFWHAVFKAQRR